MPLSNAPPRELSPTPDLRSAVPPGGKDRISQRGEPTEHPTLGWRSRAPIAIAFAIAGLALVAWLVTSRPDATLGGLPAVERAAVAERALANLRDVCTSPDRPREFCKEQAASVLQLPECDGGCRDRARAELMRDLAVK